MKRTGQVTTFYSFKGGVGRTFLLSNVAWLLARWGRRVLCVDWDLEAPGLHHYLAPVSPPRGGVYDLVLELALGKAGYRDVWRDWCEEIAGPWTGQGCLHLLRAGDDTRPSYTDGVQALHWPELAGRGFNARLEEVRQRWVSPEDGYDHVLVDSRTGISDIGGICAAQLPDLLLLVLTATHQSLRGALRMEELARATRARLPLDRGSFQSLLVPSRIHTGEEEALEKEWSSRFVEMGGEVMRPWMGREVTVDEYLSHLRVREQARWSYGEQMPVAEEALDDPNRITWAFANIAALVDLRLDRSADVVRRRRDLLLELAGEAGLQAPGGAAHGESEIFISYPWDDQPKARELQSRLEREGLRVNSDRDLRPGVDMYEWLYRARERSRVIVVLLSGRGQGKGQTDELAHVERLRHSGRATVVPVFLDRKAIEAAPPWLAGLFGLALYREKGDWSALAEQIAEVARSQSHA